MAFTNWSPPQRREGVLDGRAPGGHEEGKRRRFDVWSGRTARCVKIGRNEASTAKARSGRDVAAFPNALRTSTAPGVGAALKSSTRRGALPSRGTAGKGPAVAGGGLTRPEAQVTSSDEFNDPNNIRRAQEASVCLFRRAERTGGAPVRSRLKTGPRFARAAHVITEMTRSTQKQLCPPWNRFVSADGSSSRRV